MTPLWRTRAFSQLRPLTRSAKIFICPTAQSGLQRLFVFGEGQGFFEILDQVFTTGLQYQAFNVPFKISGELVKEPRETLVKAILNIVKFD